MIMKWHLKVGLQTDVDVSTLGDPIPQGAFNNTDPVSLAGSYSLDADYRPIGNEGPLLFAEISGGGGESSNTLVPMNDDTFEVSLLVSTQVDEPFGHRLVSWKRSGTNEWRAYY
jgi:hypothetical protein